MKKVSSSILILISFFANSKGLAVNEVLTGQERNSVKAVVRDSKTNKPITFAHVFINQTTCGTYTNIDGVFELKCDFTINKLELFISHIGYEDVTIEVNSSWVNNSKILMSPSAKELAEVTVLSDRALKERKKNLRTFKSEFIGRDKVGKKCFIENPEVISFRDSSDVLWAFSKEPIQVVNFYTGYKIEYHLKDFAFNKKTTLPKYSGNCFIQEIDTADLSVKEKWIKQRKISYEGSLPHFFNSLLTDRLDENGYLLLNESTLKIDINDNSKNSTVVVSEDIDVQYLNEFEPRSYRVWLNRILNGKFYLGSKVMEEEELSYQLTSISPNDGKILINKNGQISNEQDIVLNGYMGWERVADLMPFNYHLQQ